MVPDDGALGVGSGDCQRARESRARRQPPRRSDARRRRDRSSASRRGVHQRTRPRVHPERRPARAGVRANPLRLDPRERRGRASPTAAAAAKGQPDPTERRLTSARCSRDSRPSAPAAALGFSARTRTGPVTSSCPSACSSPNATPTTKGEDLVDDPRAAAAADHMLNFDDDEDDDDLEDQDGSDGMVSFAVEGLGDDDLDADEDDDDLPDFDGVDFDGDDQTETGILLRPKRMRSPPWTPSSTATTTTGRTSTATTGSLSRRGSARSARRGVAIPPRRWCALDATRCETTAR